MTRLGVVVASYILLVIGAGACVTSGLWLLGALAAVVAIILAARYELRWCLDHTKLTRHTPRPVPKKPVGAKHA